MSKLPFIKMNGLGNDFVILDARQSPVELSPEQIRHICARDNPLTRGCDQMIIMRPSDKADVYMEIINNDASPAGACGNATRCVGWLLMAENHCENVSIETISDILHASRAGNLRVSVNMGRPRLEHATIPMTPDIARAPVPLEEGALSGGIAVGMGNPHIIFFVPDITAVDLTTLGPKIEQRTDIFPEKVNVSVAQILADGSIKLNVWERGTGITQACGTAACATLVAAAEQGLTPRIADIYLPGGILYLAWRADDHVIMMGDIEEEMRGMLTLKHTA